jgi:23S rRNA pseudouridine1911/1915/1917 synthase
MTSQPESTRYDFTLEADSDVRLDLLVAGKLSISRTKAATLIATGHVTVDGSPARASHRPRRGETVSVNIPAPRLHEVVAENIPVAIAYEDDDLVVVEKPAGMVVHPAPGNWSGTLVNALLGLEGRRTAGSRERAGLVHRLDRDTSGLLLVARTERALAVLGDAMARRHIVRRYAALCWGHLASDELTVDKPLARDPRDRKRMAVVREGKAARTTFVRLARFDAVDLLRAHLHTGRTHQIRVHLAAIGHPVVGDDTYGGGGGRRIVDLPPRRHFLHAAWLRFRHPVTGRVIDVRSPLPDDLRSGLARVARDESLRDHPDPLDVFGFYRESA